MCCVHLNFNEKTLFNTNHKNLSQKRPVISFLYIISVKWLIILLYIFEQDIFEAGSNFDFISSKCSFVLLFVKLALQLATKSINKAKIYYKIPILQVLIIPGEFHFLAKNLRLCFFWRLNSLGIILKHTAYHTHMTGFNNYTNSSGVYSLPNSTSYLTSHSLLNLYQHMYISSHKRSDTRKLEIFLPTIFDHFKVFDL